MFRLDKLQPIHRQIMELHLQGKTNTEIGNILGRTREHIGLCINQPLFQHVLSYRRQQIERKNDEVQISSSLRVKDNLEKHTLRASEVIGELLESPDENIKFKSVKQLLDMHSGTGQSSSAPIFQINADKLAILLTALQESKELPSSLAGDQAEDEIDGQVHRSIEIPSEEADSAPVAQPSFVSTSAEGTPKYQPTNELPSDLALDHKTLF